MKKRYTTPEYKAWNTINAKHQLSQRLKSKKKKQYKRAFQNFILTERAKEQKKKKKRKGTWKPQSKTKYFGRPTTLKPPIEAPPDLRLITNTEGCLEFFRQLRSEEFVTLVRAFRYVTISLEKVKFIDYGTISILTAICDDLKFNGIIVRGDFPEDPDCLKFFQESGILNHMVDGNNKKFPKTEKSEMIFFEKGSGELLESENRKISYLIRNVIYHLTGVKKYSQAIKTIILEICGNSIEWSGTGSKQWLLGVKYENERVIFTVTDVGRGILETLFRKFGEVLKDLFTGKSRDEILFGAFEKKYGSTTQEVNRNKGLPAVKSSFDSKKIDNLKVLTNNVILHFDNPALSRTFTIGSPRFRGTFYQWEMDKNCIQNINSSSNEIN